MKSHLFILLNEIALGSGAHSSHRPNALTALAFQKGAIVTRFDQSLRTPDAAEVLRSVGDATYEWWLDTDVLSWSSNADAALGIEMAEIASGRAFARHVDGVAGGLTRNEVIRQATQRDPGRGVRYQLQYAFKRADDKIWLEDTGRWFAGPDGKPARAHGVVRVISERHERERWLEQRAKFDQLTGELNRVYLTEALGTVLDESVRFRSSCGFMLVAIDHLAHLNEAYGFDVGDAVIAQVGKRVRARLRGKDHLGRFSGNKFGVVLTSCTPEELSIAAERLLVGVRDEPFFTAAGPVAVTITIGGVIAPRHARSVTEVLSRAQDALHAARVRRRGSFSPYMPSIERDALRRQNVRAADEIVAALNERRIALAFEPVVEAQSRKIAFYECLMRIQRRDGGISQANEIIPVAERVGLVRMLDFRVLELVVAELAAAPTLHASVNVSPNSAIDPHWWQGLGALLRANTDAASRLIIEITETAAIQDLDDARGFVTRVKDLGCRIAIDDFGAGHTSFRNLRKLGVDVVKIDGAFVPNITKSNDDSAFVRTLVDLSGRLGLKSVAEWVQDEQTAAMLAEWGCDYLQGALIGLATSERPWADKGKQASA
jgi:diguanylate cyclase (GGDEF)-like protein